LLLPFAVAACATAPPPEPPVAPSPETESVEPEPVIEPVPPPASPPAPPPRSSKRITIAAVGDMMLGTDYPENHLPDDDGISFLAAVTPALSDADITFGNLEGVLLDGGEPGKKCSNPNACYLFRSPARYVQHYKRAGFDVMSLANNHARDFGEEGRLASMKTLADAGMYHSGLEGDFATMTVNGLRIAVMAYAVTRNSNLLLDYDLAKATVAGFAGTHDIVIVSFHGGAEGRDVSRLPFAEEEYFGEPRGDVVLFSRMMVDAGADLVIGHGPHVIRAMENYKDRLIAYSLGNFATYYGISVEGITGIAPILKVTLDGDGNFVEGRIHSTIQLRPAGPSLDPENRALKQLQSLSIQDFGSPGILFRDDGTIQPAPRARVRPLADTY
jgi:poly-gamma-glutamate capsule biosynthesis protein CapA/YwtB (metallophosphatase superfamily)